MERPAVFISELEKKQHDEIERLRGRLSGLLNHWREFGPEHGFDELMEAYAQNLTDPQ